MSAGLIEKCEGCGKSYSGKTAYTPDDVALCPQCAKENTTRPWTHKQETEEMLRPSPFKREDYCGGCGMLRSQCDCWDSVNQP